jgi:putative tricarboxylic transport membrane protein
MNERAPLVDICFALAMLVFAGIVWWGTADLPPPRYEPIGSAALPRALAAVMAVLSLIVLARALARQQARGTDRTSMAGSALRPRPLLAIAVFAVLVLYVLAMDQRLLGFIPASIIALTVIGGLLAGFSLKRLPWLLGFVVVMVMAIWLVFTRFFYIDLP